MRWARKIVDLTAHDHKASELSPDSAKRGDNKLVHGKAEPRMLEKSHATVLESEVCSCAGYGLPLLCEIAADEIEMLAVTLLRFIFAGFCCGKVDCWNAGVDVAINVLGENDGALFYSRVLMMGRAVQRERQGNFNFLPGNCSRIAEDEIEVLALLKAVRDGKPGPIEVALLTLARSIETPRLSSAAWSLGGLISSLANARSFARTRSDFDRPVGTVLH